MIFQQANIDTKAKRTFVDQKLKKIKNVAAALKTHGDVLPQQRLAELILCLTDLLGLGPTCEDIDKLIDLSVDVVVVDYVSPEQQLLNQLMDADGGLNIERFTKFVQGWRQVFVDTLNPQNLPPGWAVDSPAMPIPTENPNCQHGTT